MRLSLRARLILITGSVVLASIVAVAFLASRLSRTQFHRLEKITILKGPDGQRVTRRSEVEPSPREKEFAGALDRGILAVAAAAAALAILLTALLSKRIFGPIESLTRAARAMEAGERDRRVGTAGEDEVGELARAFDAMADAVARQEELRRRLVADVAHELRAPLTNIRGQIEAMQDGLVPPQPAALESLHEETMALARLADDLQDLALAEAGELKMSFAPVHLEEAVGRAVAAHQSRAQSAGVRLETDIPASLPHVRADERRLGQILRNLVENALAHTPGGGRIGLSAEVRDGHALVTVADTGSGIAAEDLPRVFERFYRSDESRSRQTGGAGLGLPIVRQMVLGHGGEISIESEPGRGTAVRFTLPFIRNS
jgi:two-component system sensor histidine kinase BaeS